MRIRELAPGKINLCLFLGPIRGDGRHELVTLYESVSLADELVIEGLSLDVAADHDSDVVVAPGVEGRNLVSDALDGLRERGWQAPPLRVQIDKRIPVAAGMGGGSADAAAVLRVAPRIAPVPEADLAALAARLGADVPAQRSPGVVLGTGAGDIVAQQRPLAAHAWLIVPLEARLSTPEVYAEADRLGLPRGEGELRDRLDELERGLEAGGRLPDELVVNDLEPAARSLCPGIEDALEAVHSAGADHAMVCGSGPTVAGIYWGDESMAAAEAASGVLSEAFPRVTVAVPVSSPE